MIPGTERNVKEVSSLFSKVLLVREAFPAFMVQQIAGQLRET